MKCEQCKKTIAQEPIKIFENGTVKECLARCLAEGYRPATLQEVTKLRETKQIPDQWYNTSTLWWKRTGVIIDATQTDFANIEGVYEMRGRLLYVNDTNSGLLGYCDLNNSGRFVGVARDAPSKNAVKK